ncbi:MAG: DinB family protein [Ferruginibacter sp.]
MITVLTEIFERDLNKLITEINAYTNETNIWAIRPGISNSAGNLCLHLVGNLNHFIGATLDNNGYVRNRDAEFALKNIPRSELVSSLEKTIAIVKAGLENQTAASLQEIFPLEPFGKKMITEFMLVHLTTHLSYHLGQINYHRRMIEGS